MCLIDRKTTSRGRSTVPATFLQTELPPVATLFPGLRRMNPPRMLLRSCRTAHMDSFALVRMPLPLYGSGPGSVGSHRHLADQLLLGPLIVTMVLLATANVIPAGALYSTGWEYRPLR